MKRYLVLSSLLFVACSSTPDEVGNVAKGESKPTTVASIEAKQVAAEQEAAHVVEIQFDKKSAKLNAAAKAKIEALYKNVAEPKRLKGVKVISWADEEYPSESDKKLGAGQVDLAKKRGETVQSILKARNGEMKIELYNMAKRPGAFGEFIGSEDARIKDSLERAGISTTDDKAVSKARKAIVMLILGDEK